MDKIRGRARLQWYLLSCVPALSPLTAKASECTSQNSTRRMNVVTLGRRTRAVGGVQRSREVREELTRGGMLGHVDACACTGLGLLSGKHWVYPTQIYYAPAVCGALGWILGAGNCYLYWLSPQKKPQKY